ncbi:hypothetical protein GH714_036738 [Hevea brasiliensis]|uniref:HAT C-terminal dimerisation domain-containing protein n=1 Tax=Hevea brasiliensis TaxID=3981 RepID=A0A6A6KFQ0_HEVBR|nr:hypothetical protein GH714_036738 [Hevea brasiliensis]
MLPSQTPLDVDENVQQPNANEIDKGNITQSTAHLKLKSRSGIWVHFEKLINFEGSKIEEWGFSKVMCITIDNASSNDSAISQLKKRLLKKNAFALGGDAFHMRCCAYIIQLVMRDGLNVVQGISKNFLRSSFWWKVNLVRYLVLSKVVKDVLAIQCLTVAFESAFSTGGRALHQFRSSLLPTTVEVLICYQDWLRSETKHIQLEESIEELESWELETIQDPEVMEIIIPRTRVDC